MNASAPVDPAARAASGTGRNLLGAGRWYALAAATAGIDQAAKWVAVALLAPNHSVPALPFLSWTFACNTGAAFSLFQGFGAWLGWLALLVAAYLVVEIWRSRQGLLEGLAYALVLGGAVGNLVDRLLHGCVVDFVHVHYGWFNFPVFNVADSAITVGAACWIWTALRGGAGPGRA